MKSLKTILRAIFWILITFIFIFTFVFFGGYKFFESQNPILIEFGVSIILGGLLFSVFEGGRKFEKHYDSKIAELEKRIEDLEHKNN
ncbi:MAG: hypothetical protein IJ447_00590 [Clostridia bacterium]|nr:hypothetical protein [Clostridia bacterium]